jgi:hypothetical protein
VLTAIGRLVERTGEEAFTVATVFTEMAGHGTQYRESSVNKAMSGCRAISILAPASDP